MPATSLLSLALLSLSGVLLDAQRREFRNAQQDAADDGGLTFAVRRLWRRQTANVAIGLVGVMFALWPLLPREPTWVFSYTVGMLLLTGLIFLLGLSDAWASFTSLRAERQALIAMRSAELQQILDDTANASAAHPDPADVEA